MIKRILVAMVILVLMTLGTTNLYAQDQNRFVYQVGPLTLETWLYHLDLSRSIDGAWYLDRDDRDVYAPEFVNNVYYNTGDDLCLRLKWEMFETGYTYSFNQRQYRYPYPNCKPKDIDQVDAHWVYFMINIPF